jgi:hypothetical protein
LIYPSFSQGNLIPNGGFENYSVCPTGFGGIANLYNWFQPNTVGNSSDAYNNCNGDIPYSGIYYQYPKEGNGFAAINLFNDTSALYEDWNREYIEVGLLGSLAPGKKYCIRFFINKGNWSIWAIKNIQGVLTSDSLLYTDSNYGFITGVVPFIEADSIIKDTLNWIPIETTYIASGGERFLTIGNFSPGNVVTYQQVLPSSSFPNTIGYYLFDDISIYEQPEIFAGNDTTLSLGDSVQLGLTGKPDIFYSWAPTAGLSDPNIANPMASPGITTTYTLTVTDTNELACTNTFTDTIRIEVGSNGINELQNNSFGLQVYPNPFVESVTFKTKINDAYRIRVTDIIGKEILNAAFEGDQYVLKDKTLNSGIYFYEIRNKNEESVKGKFFKK